MIASEKTTPSTVQQADGQATAADLARRAHDRRSERALAGWLATRMRAQAHDRRRGGGEEPPRVQRTARSSQDHP
jgi:hypothetical protein